MDKMKKLLARAGVATTGSLVAVTSAHADIATDIAAAQTAGVSNATLAGAAVIAIVAAVVGIGIVKSLLRSS